MPMPPLQDPLPSQSGTGRSKADQEPVFNAPWEAKAFAIVNQLTTLEHCTWPEWTQYLSAAIAATENADPGAMTYYEQWIMACEKLLADKGLLDAQAIDQKMHELASEKEAEHRH
ncbi:nitrile hydratase accessory protein [Halomicronema sp. CCY15110]|uniref:nitrile hydratase accessory protein n=1 Tax=Halomicronema sp. CCY15110 TaxID=2767773 RepID=UPI00194E621A|nr:nitrile hydratase accessory protein [Halomicronema sp. CCY15110]